jgi:CRP-like cAMP-binding protein
MTMTSGRATSADSMRDAKAAFLSESELFSGLDERDLAEIERSTTMSSCERGRVFYTPGESGEVLFILKSGRVNLSRMTAEGKRLITATLDSGSVFGEMALTGQGMLDSYAEAAEDCVLCVMSRSDVERLLGEHPGIAIRLLEILARRLADAEQRLADVAYKSVPARIATVLLRLSGDASEPVRLSQQDVADMVGTYRETATRILNELRGDGLVDLKRMRIDVLDRAGLEAVAAQGD